MPKGAKLDDNKKSSTPDTSGVGSIVADLTGAIPEPSVNAEKVARHILDKQEGNIRANSTESRGRKKKSAAEIESELKALGETYDPNKSHAASMNQLKNAKRRAGGGSSTVARLPAQEAEEAVTVQKYKEMGAFMAGAFFGITSAIDSEEWQPTPQEDKSISEGFERVAIHYQWDDLHPVLMLTISIVSYALPRLKKPKTSEKFGKLKSWLYKRMK